MVSILRPDIVLVVELTQSFSTDHMRMLHFVITCYIVLHFVFCFIIYAVSEHHPLCFCRDAYFYLVGS